MLANQDGSGEPRARICSTFTKAFLLFARPEAVHGAQELKIEERRTYGLEAIYVNVKSIRTFGVDGTEFERGGGRASRRTVTLRSVLESPSQRVTNHTPTVTW